MSALVTLDPMQLPAAFRGAPVGTELSDGVGQSFATLSIKGKVFRIRHRGEEQMLMRPPLTPGGPSDGPMNSMPVVIVKASPAISKIWYEKGFNEGDNAAPDCSSTDGMKPDPASPKPQCATCQACPRNVWGSKMMPNGKAGKECQDSKRMAIVPAGDIKNEMYGGPVLMRIPAGSLQDMASYNQQLQAMGIPYYAVETVISFDPEVAHPKILFTARRVLTDPEAVLVVEQQNNPVTQRLLAEPVAAARHEGVGALGAGGIAAGAQVAGTAPVAPVPVAHTTPAPVAVVAAQPIVQAQPVATTAPPPEPPVDLTPPSFLQRPAPVAPVAPAAVPVATYVPEAQPVTLTPEQQQIENLKAQLAQLTGDSTAVPVAAQPTASPAPAPATPPVAAGRRSTRGAVRAAAAAPPPSPQPTTAAPAQPPQPVVAQPTVSTPPGGGFGAVAAPAMQTAPQVEAPGAAAPIEADLDAKLQALIG